MNERIARDHVTYDKWVNSKHLYATPGNVVDYDFVEAKILAANEQYDIQTLGTDIWNSRMLTQRLMKSGVNVIEIPQNMKYMSPAMKMVEQLMKKGKMTHEANPVARWCWGNVVVATDGNENIKPMKNLSRERIDITVALIIAMATAMMFEEIDFDIQASTEDYLKMMGW